MTENRLLTWVPRDFILNLSCVTANEKHDVLAARNPSVLAPYELVHEHETRVLMLSYPWQERDSPDANAAVLHIVQAFLRAHAQYTHVFWDFMSISQDAGATMAAFQRINLHYFDCDTLVVDAGGYARRAWCVVELFLSSINPHTVTHVYSAPDVAPLAIPEDGFERILCGVEWVTQSTVTSSSDDNAEPTDNARICAILTAFSERLYELHYTAELRLNVQRFRAPQLAAHFTDYRADGRKTLAVKFGEVAACLFDQSRPISRYLTECHSDKHESIVISMLPNTQCWLCALPALFCKYPRGCVTIFMSVTPEQRARYLLPIVRQLANGESWATARPHVTEILDTLPAEARTRIDDAINGEHAKLRQEVAAARAAAPPPVVHAVESVVNPETGRQAAAAISKFTGVDLSSFIKF